MPFDWAEYLALAEWLRANAGTNALPGDAAAALRSSVSRSYYAAFHASMALLVTRNEYTPLSTGEDHRGVLGLFLRDKLNRQPRIQIGTWLQRLKARRSEADYDRTVAVDANVATACVRDARQIMQYLARQ